MKSYKLSDKCRTMYEIVGKFRGGYLADLDVSDELLLSLENVYNIISRES